MAFSPLPADYERAVAEVKADRFEITRLRARVAELEAKLKVAEEALVAMVEDGWLCCGAEGMSEAQEKCYSALAKIKEAS